MLIDKDRVSVGIDQHQTGRAGGGFISLGSERKPFGFKALLNLPNIGEPIRLRSGQASLSADGDWFVISTVDQGVRYQQNLTGRQIGILELSTNKLRLIEAAASQIKEAVDSIGPTEFRRFEILKPV